MRLAIFLLPLLMSCYVSYDIKEPPEQPKQRMVYMNQVDIRPLSEDQPISHDENAPIWMKVGVRVLPSKTSEIGMTCIFSGLTFGALPCIFYNPMHLTFNFEVPGTTIHETKKWTVQRSQYVWLPLLLAGQVDDLEPGHAWLPVARSKNPELAKTIDAINDQLLARQEKANRAMNDPETYPIIVLGTHYKRSKAIPKHHLLFSLRNNTDRTISQIDIQFYPARWDERKVIKPRRSSRSDAMVATGVGHYVFPVECKGPIEPGVRTLFEIPDHYAGAPGKRAHIWKTRIVYADGEVLTLNKEESMRLLFEAPIPPARVLNNERAYRNVI